MEIPTLETARLILRPFGPGDAEALHPMWIEPETIRYFPFKSEPDLARVERIVNHQAVHWEERGYGWWAIALKPGGEFAGWCGLQYLPDTDEVEVAYMLARPHWGKGLGTEAAVAATRFAFETLGMDWIVGIVHVGNRASQRVLEKLGGPERTRQIYFEMDSFRYLIKREVFSSLNGEK